MPATEGPWRVASRHAIAESWIDRAAIASIAMVLAIGTFLVFRRALGALTLPLPALTLLGTATGLVAWAVWIRAIWKPRFAVRTPQMRAVIATLLPAMAIFLFALGCSYPGKRVVDWLAWIAAAIALNFSLQLLELVRRHSPRSGPQPATLGELSDPTAPPLQQIARYRAPDGTHSIHGTLIAEFGPGERSTTMYVAFCPPFERLPAVEVEAMDDSSASVKLAQLLHNGAQFEVRLPQTNNDPRSVTIEFVAAEAELVK